MKIKAKDNGKFNITGLGSEHLIVLNAVLSHVRLGDGEASDYVFDMIKMFEDSAEFEYESQFYDKPLVSAHSDEGTEYIDAPTIEVNFE